ncbi:gliding motility-associated C-terminal domain-containing protein [Pedobacter psychroterrae]|uniref:Gliding motility-associated C-terminal domain-containing protein n=1 Tax=Pedobacter psychroterrae TaxID=2530453 RepID=A0A4R0N973_9SPHI|nr:gliding motility-associated C-terminal domain-containing protein [Pedobacter psychroterrae]TCC96721.1 gliding motility-associated C-terminal domain-containing protein [Pedobacter psychroterrae]
MKLSSLVTLLLLMMSLQGFSQLQLQLDPTPFMQGVEMGKVIVCKDDQSVWALSAAGKVYVKRAADSDFSLYAPMSARTVIDLDGYSYNEMYFLTAPATIYYFKNQVGTTMSLSSVTKINNIAIVYGSQNSTLTGYYDNRDWLAAATSTGIHPIFRNDITGSAPAPLGGMPVLAGNPEWRITNSGFKSIDFQFKHQSTDPCAGATTHQYYNMIGSNYKTTRLPEAPSPNDVVTCTYFEAPFNHAKNGGSTLINFWGTMDGLYAMSPDGCAGDESKLLGGKAIYDIEEIYGMRDVMNDKFVLVATSEGLFYTPSRLLGNQKFDFQFTNLVSANAALGKVLSIATEIKEENNLCQKVIWLATANGIRKLTANMTSELLARPGMLTYYEPSLNPQITIYRMCKDREIRITANVPSDYLGKYQISWLKNNVEVMDLRDKADVFIKEYGDYEFRLTEICSGAFTKLGNIFLLRAEDPEITFKNNGDINICAGGSTTFTTKKPADNSYNYQWVRNGVDIDNATNNTYTASLPGMYKVKVGNCMETFFESEEVRVNVADMDIPVITRSNNKSLCFGETVNLSIPVVNGATYKWNSGETTAAIDVKKTGNYRVEVKMGTCGVVSEYVNVTVADEIVLDKVPDVKICVLRQDQVKLTAADGYAFYTWNGLRGTDTVFTVSQPGQYTLEIEDLNGCKANTVYVVLSYCAVLAPPNAFSPNGDGTNDLWVVEGLEADPDATIIVYNRFGVQVFSTKGSKPVWDGRSHNVEVPAGVYYYVVTSKNVSKPLKGAISVIR